MERLKLEPYEDVPKNYTGMIEYSDETVRWYKKGERHRLDGPAVVWPDGTKFWFREGLLHRTDGPAKELENNRKEWWIVGKKYNFTRLVILEKKNIFLGTEKGRYDLEWLKFLTEEGIEEFPIIPGMEEYGDLGIKIKEIKEKDLLFDVAAENIR